MNEIDPKRLVSWPPQLKRGQVLAVIGAIALALIGLHRIQRKAVAESASLRSHIPLARMSEEISVHAAGRGNPYINLSDGHDLVTPYTGPAELTRLLERNEARALSLCSADFDEDGVPDLISGYAGPTGGIITLLRGNVDSIYPNAPEAQHRRAEGTFTDAPFLSPAFVVGLPEAAEFIGAGDFDGDGHWDVVAGARGSDKLSLMSGDGKGGLRETKRIALPGGVTAMVAGEINRRDGLDDVVVGVSGKQGSRVLVFEGPEGALRANPEVFDLPAEATSLALGQLDDSYEMDLAIAAGHELMIVHGRDRKLSLDARVQREVPQAAVSRQRFRIVIRSVALGSFMGSSKTDIALLSDEAVYVLEANRLVRNRQAASSVMSILPQQFARHEWNGGGRLVTAHLSSAAADSLVLVSQESNNANILTADLGGKWRVTHSDAELRFDPRLDDASPGIAGRPVAVLPMRLNRDALSDLVFLNTRKSEPAVTMTLPQTVLTVSNVNDSGPGSLRQAILDANGSAGPDVISFNIGAGLQTINLESPLPPIGDPLTIDGTTQPGFEGTPIIEVSGAGAGPNANGLVIFAGHTTIRGLVLNRFDRSTFGSPLFGVRVWLTRTGGNVVEGNFIGTDVSGKMAFAQGYLGVFIQSVPNNIVGGTVSAARNVIASNPSEAILIDGSEATDNSIRGNLIGIDSTGGVALSSSGRGIQIGTGGSNNTIGGTIPGARNVISGNSEDGILIHEEARGNLIQGNFIGTDVSGTKAVSNGASTTDKFAGVQIEGSDSVRTPDNTIGGTTVAARNVISGNNLDGIEISGEGATGELVQGNFLGTNAGGTEMLGNSRAGVSVTQAPDATIGGSVPARNIISGNHRFGIGLGLSRGPELGGTRTSIQDNYIGTGADGSSDLGNNGDGIFIENNAIANLIERNRVAFNAGSGIRIPNSTSPRNFAGIKNQIISNSIFSNSDLAVDLGPPGVTENDSEDLDTGANELQNFPELSSANIMNKAGIGSMAFGPAAMTRVAGKFNSAPNTLFTLEFFFGSSCSASGHQFTGSIPLPVGTLQVFTDSSGTAQYTFDFIIPTGFSGGFINSTATDPNGNTSEISTCLQVGICLYLTNPAAALIGSSAGTNTFSVTAANGCDWAAVSDSAWLITSSTGSGNGTVTYSFAENTASNVRIGVISVGTSSHTVTQRSASTGARITSACKGEGKQLIVHGSGFVEGAKVFLNGEQEKTSFVSPTQVIAKKAGKRAQTGDTLKVRNPDGSETNVLAYSRNNCSP